MQKILILATGGTIASDVTENGLAPELTAADIVSGSAAAVARKPRNTKLPAPGTIKRPFCPSLPNPASAAA